MIFITKKNGSLKSNIQTLNLFLEKGLKTPKHCIFKIKNEGISIYIVFINGKQKQKSNYLSHCYR